MNKNEFIIDEVVDLNTKLQPRIFPLTRARDLQQTLARAFSRHLGALRSGGRFEADCVLLTGPSGCGKTREMNDLLRRFMESEALLPDGQPARFLECVLDSKEGWKGLGKKTIKAMGYPISDSSRLTQTAIWERVVTQARMQGYVGIHYDEAQHILRGKSENDLRVILDAFKTLTKSHDWPLMLILSGIPDLAVYVQEEQQLHRLVTHRISFSDIDLSVPDDGATPADYGVIHEVVGSYAVSVGLELEENLMTLDFYHRLATAAAFRWGNLIKLTFDAAVHAAACRSELLTLDHFVDVWCERTDMTPLVTPFTHEGYQTLFRKEKPFQAAITT